MYSEVMDMLFVAILSFVVSIYFLFALFSVIVVLSIVKYKKIKSEDGKVWLVAQLIRKNKIITSFLVVLPLIFVVYFNVVYAAISPFVAIRFPAPGNPREV